LKEKTRADVAGQSLQFPYCRTSRLCEHQNGNRHRRHLTAEFSIYYKLSTGDSSLNDTGFAVATQTHHPRLRGQIDLRGPA